MDLYTIAPEWKVNQGTGADLPRVDGVAPRKTTLLLLDRSLTEIGQLQPIAKGRFAVG